MITTKKTRALLAASISLATAAAALLVAAPPASAAPGELGSGACLDSNTSLYSPGGGYALTMQGDGNLVLYAPGHVATWATGTSGRSGAIACLQTDGNFVIIAPGNVAVWASGTSGRPGTVLQLQDDGNLVLYAPGHVSIWATNTGGTVINLGSTIVRLATAESKNSTHNHENGRDCNFYSGAVSSIATACGNGWRSEPWCADFARWVYGQAGASTEKLDAGAASFHSYGVRFHTWHDGLAGVRVGDAVVFNLNSAGTYASHVGIVSSISGGVVMMISGNYSNAVKASSLISGLSGYAEPVAR